MPCRGAIEVAPSSKRTSVESRDPRLPTRHTRLLLWGVPKYLASSTLHERPYPNSANVWRRIWKSRPLWLLRSPGTFPITSQRGLLDSMSSENLKNNPLLSPPNPFLLPWFAKERSWQGKPPHQISDSGICPGVKSFISPQSYVSGQCFLKTL